MNKDEAIETVVAIARQILVLNDTLPKEIDITPSMITKLTDAILIVEGLKSSKSSRGRFQLCGKHEDPKDYVPFPDSVEGMPHPD